MFHPGVVIVDVRPDPPQNNLIGLIGQLCNLLWWMHQFSLPEWDLYFWVRTIAAASTNFGVVGIKEAVFPLVAFLVLSSFSFLPLKFLFVWWVPRKAWNQPQKVFLPGSLCKWALPHGCSGRAVN